MDMAPADGERHSPTGVTPPSAPDGFLNLTQLAERDGLTKAAISKTVAQLRAKAGLVVRAGKGREILVDPVAYAAAKARLADLNRPQTLPLDRPPSADPSPAGAAAMERSEKVQAAKARQAEADAARAEMRLAQESGRLCSVAKAEATTVDLFTTVRERLQALPAKVSPRIARMTDKREIAIAIRAAIDDAFDKIADDIQSGVDLIDTDDVGGDDIEADPGEAAGEE